MGDQAGPTATTGAQPYNARKLKYWGMGLAWLGFVCEFLAGIFVRPEAMTVAALVSAVGVCAVGTANYSKAKGSSYAWGLFGLVPVLGFPLFLFLFPLFTDFRRHWVHRVLSIAIMGILAAIAIPNFLNYGAKSRQSEARVNLRGISTAATSLQMERYTFVISDINQLGFMPGGIARYSLWYAVNSVPTRIPLPVGSHYRPGPCDVLAPPTSVKVTATTTAFTAAAKGNLEGHFGCDEWSINEKKELVHTLDETKD